MKLPTKPLTAADLFCGAGGTSQGLLEAAAALGYECNLTAINHWPVAVATHEKNHPNTRHLCTGVDTVNPTALFKPGELDLLWASPACTHHSIARGGKPVDDQSRATAWCVVRWAEALRPPVILVENVKEFLDWGPTTAAGKPIKSRKGELYRAWVGALEAIGYRVQHALLCAADYGDPTSRRRLFVQAVLGRRKIRWPLPTHHGRWKPARDIIDWSDSGRSIFDRKKPLAPKTMERIRVGLEKFGGAPFIAFWDHQSSSPEASVRSAEEPLSTVTTKARHGVCQPFLIELRGTHPSQIPGTSRSIEQPMPTLTAGGGHVGLVQPFLLPQQRGGAPVHSIDKPLSTVTTAGAHSLVTPFITPYYGTAGARPVTEPLDTVTCKPRFGLVQPIIKQDGREYRVDIRFRMLTPRELARAQGFPDTYQFTGRQEDIQRQIGNAVPCGLARAIVTEVLKPTSTN